MKTHRLSRFTCRVLPLLFLLAVYHAKGETNDIANDFPFVIPCEMGDAEFPAGDEILIKQVRSTSDQIKVGEKICVEGTYTLDSKDKADIALYFTTIKHVSTPTEPTQTMRIEKGSGKFRLIATMSVEGYPHVSFYSVGDGNAFAGIYFGQDKWVLHHKGFGYQDRILRDRKTNHGGTSPTATGANKALYEYLGNPVEPPADLDPAYSKEGLTQAVQTAARNAGISLVKVEIEDSEFPYLIGIVCKSGDYPKLTAEIRKLDGYAYQGSVGTQTLNIIDIVPPDAIPPELSTRISHRTTLRQQKFYYEMVTHQ